jgi:hypothetical protein
MNKFDKVALLVLSVFPLVILIVSTVGVQMTFAVTLPDIPDPTTDFFDKQDVRRFAALSSLLFLFVVFACFAAGVLVILHGEEIKRGLLRKRRLLLVIAVAVLFAIEIITFAAFACMGLAIAAYDSRVGFFAVAMVILGALLTCVATAAYLVHFKRGKSENI